MNASFRSAAVLLPLVLASSASAGVIIVDSHGGGQFTNLQMAVNNAQDGDTLLVKNGAYSGFTIDDKSLTIVAESGATVTVASSIHVLNLSAARTVVLAGLSVTAPPSGFPATALYLLNDAGAVRAQACAFRGPNADLAHSHYPGSGAMVSTGTGGVAFVDCVFRGGDGGECFYCDSVMGGTGLEVYENSVALYDCQVRGGDGSYGQDYVGGTGGRGAVVGYPPAFLHSSGTSIRGGDGGWGCDWQGAVPGGAGDGLYLGADGAAWTVESSVSPGDPAYSYPVGYCFGPPELGPPGQAFAGAGTHFDLGVARLRMQAPTLVRESNAAVVTITGTPGDMVFLSTSVATVFVGIPSFHGVWLLRRGRGPHVARILGPIPPSGVLIEGIPIGELPAGVPADTFFLQAWSRMPSVGRTIGSFAALTVLDSAY